jgi:hypothetical protein
MHNFRHLHLLGFASTTRNPQSYGFHIADSPVALWRQSILIMAQRNILFSPSELHAGQRITIHFGGPFGTCTRVLLAILLPSTNSYKSLRSDPPPRFENVETIEPTRISQQQ